MWRCSGGATVLVMETAEVRESDDVAALRELHRAWLRTVRGSGKVRSGSMVIGHVRAKNPCEVPLVEHNDMVEAFPPH